MKRKIFSLTGARADYGRLKPVWEAIKKHPRLNLITAVTGMHLLEKCGYTIKHILSDGFKPDFQVDIFKEEEDGLSMTKALGRGIIAFTDIINECKPDFILVQGDRSEMLIPAIIGTHFNIPVAHIAGGFVSAGVVDEVIRHSITKMSHIHLATSKDCAERIIKMGEENWRVYVVGSPAIDLLMNMSYESKSELFKRFQLSTEEPLFIATYHPVTTEKEDCKNQIRELLSALKYIGVQTIITYPNLDYGGRVIIEEIEKLKKNKLFRIVKNLSTETHLNFLKYANLLIGNSSSGFVEALYFHLPMINIGNRQMGRKRYKNIIDVSADSKIIVKRIKEYLYNSKFREELRKDFNYPYGKGNAGQSIAQILAEIKIDRRLIQKITV